MDMRTKLTNKSLSGWDRIVIKRLMTSSFDSQEKQQQHSML